MKLGRLILLHHYQLIICLLKNPDYTICSRYSFAFRIQIFFAFFFLYLWSHFILLPLTLLCLKATLFYLGLLIIAPKWPGPSQAPFPLPELPDPYLFYMMKFSSFLKYDFKLLYIFSLQQFHYSQVPTNIHGHLEC